MVWLLLACFGYSSKKRKRLRPARHVHSVDNADQGSYELLKGSPTSPVVLGSAPDQERDCNPTRSNLKIRRRSSCGNQGRVVTRKKVRFDLNVVKYEPIPAHCDDDDDENQDDGIVEFKEKEEDDDVSDGDQGSLEDFLLGLSGSRIVRSIHGNYRYSNCYEDDDEEEEITFEADDDLDQKDREGEEEGICIFDPRGVYDDELSNSSDLLPSKAAPYHEKDPSAAQDSGSLGQSARSQSLYDVMKNPVLIPIENLHQWKTMKAKKLQPVA